MAVTRSLELPAGEHHLLIQSESSLVPDDVRAAPLILIEPNPFRSAAMLRFVLPAKGWVDLEIFDAAGKRVWERSVENLPAGEHLLPWDGCNPRGELLPAGVYLVRMTGPPEGGDSFRSRGWCRKVHDFAMRRESVRQQ
jgi:hypothetical protein